MFRRRVRSVSAQDSDLESSSARVVTSGSTSAAAAHQQQQHGDDDIASSAAAAAAVAGGEEEKEWVPAQEVIGLMPGREQSVRVQGFGPYDERRMPAAARFDPTDSHHVQRSDGKLWSRDELRNGQDQLYYGDEYLKLQEERRRLLENDPNYRFLSLVAGHSNQKVLQLYDQDDLEWHTRRPMQRQRMEQDRNRRLLARASDIKNLATNVNAEKDIADKMKVSAEADVLMEAIGQASLTFPGNKTDNSSAPIGGKISISEVISRFKSFIQAHRAPREGITEEVMARMIDLVGERWAPPEILFFNTENTKDNKDTVGVFLRRVDELIKASAKKTPGMAIQKALDAADDADLLDEDGDGYGHGTGFGEEFLIPVTAAMATTAAADSLHAEMEALPVSQLKREDWKFLARLIRFRIEVSRVMNDGEGLWPVGAIVGFETEHNNIETKREIGRLMFEMSTEHQQQAAAAGGPPLIHPVRKIEPGVVAAAGGGGDANVDRLITVFMELFGRKSMEIIDDEDANAVRNALVRNGLLGSHTRLVEWNDRYNVLGEETLINAIAIYHNELDQLHPLSSDGLGNTTTYRQGRASDDRRFRMSWLAGRDDILWTPLMDLYRYYRAIFNLRRVRAQRNFVHLTQALQRMRALQLADQLGQPLSDDPSNQMVPYEHSAGWRAKPENSGVIRLAATVFSALGEAWSKIQRYAPVLLVMARRAGMTERDAICEALQRSEPTMVVFSKIVAMQVLMQQYENPRSYKLHDLWRYEKKTEADAFQRLHAICPQLWMNPATKLFEWRSSSSSVLGKRVGGGDNGAKISRVELALGGAGVSTLLEWFQ